MIFKEANRILSLEYFFLVLHVKKRLNINLNLFHLNDEKVSNTSHILFFKHFPSPPRKKKYEMAIR